jgi:glyoxylase-like metal-dependent hydrolase (beta-lactamase superfamily II)
MRGSWRAAAAALLLMTTTAPAALAQTTPAVPIVQVAALKAVSAHVQVIPDGSVPLVPNVSFVVGSKGVLVIDTGLGPKNGAAVAEVAQRLAKGGAIWLVTTHAHPEHDLGAQAFPASIKLIRSKDQVADIDAQGMRLAQVFAGRSPAIADLLKGAEFRKADIVFDRSYDLDLGGVSARILAMGSNHTDGDTAVWVAGDRVLFSGDLAMMPQPSLMSTKTSMAQWMKTLDALEALKPAVVVPSHGPVGEGVALIAGYRDYLREVADRTAKAKAAGQSLEAATATVTEAMATRYPDKARLSGAVRVAYAGG